MLLSLALVATLAADPAPPAPTQGVFIVNAIPDSGAKPVVVKGNARLNCRLGVDDKPCFLALPPGAATLAIGDLEASIMVPEGISWFRLTSTGHHMAVIGYSTAGAGAGVLVALLVIAAAGGGSELLLISSWALLGALVAIPAIFVGLIIVLMDAASSHEQLEPMSAPGETPPVSGSPAPAS